ncbi:MAG: carboxypeptidase regulatory-like domain-containing protein [Acidobacteriota bacterium]
MNRPTPWPSLLLLVLILTSCQKKSDPASTLPTYFKPDPLTAGSINGRVIFAGRPLAPRRVEMDGDPQCARLHDQPVSDEEIAITRVGGESRLANVFVYLKSGLEGRVFQPPAEPVVIEQRGCWFGPRVQGIMVGQTLQVINADPLTHNIHPLAKVNREWNQSQSPGDPPLTRRFTQPEVMIRVKCNIHNWMHAWVGAVSHPYYSVTSRDGEFTLAGLPPGDYVLEAWHERLGRQEQAVKVTTGGRTELLLNFKGE